MKNEGGAATGTAKATSTPADKINAELAAGRHVTAHVYNAAYRYSPKHAGAFSMDSRGHIVFTRGKRTVTFLPGTVAFTVDVVADANEEL